MLIVAILVALLAGQDPPTPAEAESDADRSSRQLTGEDDLCARREQIATQYAQDLVERMGGNATPADRARYLAMALDMYDASHSMSHPQGSPPADLAEICEAPSASW